MPERIVILVPSEDDLTRPDYITTYWPNFVAQAREILASLKCVVLVAEPPKGKGNPR